MTKKSFWNSDKIVGVSAILISLMTLIVLIYQTNIFREQQRLSVLPYLSVTNENFGGPKYKLNLKNNGIGPAFIESVKIIYEEKEYDKDIPTFLYDHIPEMDSIKNIYHSNTYPGQLIPAGGSYAILEVKNSMEDAKKLFKILETYDFEIDIIYKSIYGERWILSSRFETPQPQKLD